MNRINLICLGVVDMKKALAFYKNMGFQTAETAENPPIVFFNSTGTKLELFPLAELTKEIDSQNPPTINQGFSGITLAINLKSKAEVDALMKRAVTYGGTIVKPPVQNPNWDGYSGYFKDLDGYYWEVAYGASWEFDENDMLVL